LGEQFLDELARIKGNTKIIASYHDLNGGLDWASPFTKQIYQKSCAFGDIVQMIGFANALTDNFELEHFRRWTTEDVANACPLIAFNGGLEGKLSRILNPFLEPTTHHLLPISSAPHQLTLLEANSVLGVLGQMPPLTFCILNGSSLSTLLFEKCFNELGLPHKCIQIERDNTRPIECMLDVPNFGGAFLYPSLCEDLKIHGSHTSEPRSTGVVDTIAMQHGSLIGYNCLALGIRSLLLRHNSSLAYFNKMALIVANWYEDSAGLMDALLSLRCKKIYILGFKLPATLPSAVTDVLEQFQMRASEKGNTPLIGVFSALSADKAELIPPLIRMVGRTAQRSGIFMDVVNHSGRGTPGEIARVAGWKTIAATDITASTTAERLRILANQTVPNDFLRMVQKRGLY
jgi:3-dehydroquinate dehydratase-1